MKVCKKNIYKKGCVIVNGDEIAVVSLAPFANIVFDKCNLVRLFYTPYFLVRTSISVGESSPIKLPIKAFHFYRPLELALAGLIEFANIFCVESS